MYNPAQHHRRSIRLKGYDYARAGMYFVTICCEKHECRFGKIVNGEMILNEYGKIACDEWTKLSERYSHVTFDVFQIMPNHIHGIIIINEPGVVGAALAAARDNDAVARDDIREAVDGLRAGASLAPTNTTNTTVGNIVGAYKSLVANGCLKIYKQNNQTMGKLWQRYYYEHIIRNEQAYQRIAEYIMNNPAKWEDDKLNMK